MPLGMSRACGKESFLFTLRRQQTYVKRHSLQTMSICIKSVYDHAYGYVQCILSRAIHHPLKVGVNTGTYSSRSFFICACMGFQHAYSIVMQSRMHSWQWWLILRVINLDKKSTQSGWHAYANICIDISYTCVAQLAIKAERVHNGYLADPSNNCS